MFLGKSVGPGMQCSVRYYIFMDNAKSGKVSVSEWIICLEDWKTGTLFDNNVSLHPIIMSSLLLRHIILIDYFNVFNCSVIIVILSNF